MNMKEIALLSAGVACILSTPAASQSPKDWVNLNSQKELRALFVNKTFKGKDHLDRPFVEHFREDGKGIRIYEDNTRIPRGWTVKGNNQVCISYPWEVPCYRMQRHKSTTGLYRLINLANDEVTAITVQDGVPQF